MGEPKVYRHGAVFISLSELLGKYGQKVRQTHLGLTGKEALDELFVLHEPELQERHHLQRRLRLPADGPLHKDLRDLRNLALGHGFGVGALPSLTGEREVPEDVPGLQETQGRLLTTRVGPEQLHDAGDENVEGVTVLALAVDGISRPVHPVGRGYSHAPQDPQ